MDKIKVGYKNYELVKEERVFDNNNQELYGEINYDVETIRISKRFSKNLQNQAILHELIHAIADRYQLDINKDERTVDLLAAGIYELILDNTGLAMSFISNIGKMKKSVEN